MTTPRKGTVKTSADDSTPPAEAATDDTAADTATASDSTPVSADTTDASPAPAAEGSTILATPPFTAEFRVGQHVITTSGTPIPASEAESVRVAALRSGIALREIQ
jgi:hypothetical protein